MSNDFCVELGKKIIRLIFSVDALIRGDLDELDRINGIMMVIVDVEEIVGIMKMKFDFVRNHRYTRRISKCIRIFNIVQRTVTITSGLWCCFSWVLDLLSRFLNNTLIM